MMKTPVYITLFFLFLLSSCEDIIHIDLNTSDPQIIIVGEVRSSLVTQYVEISQTVSFFADNPHQPVSGAEVTVQDDQGRQRVFTEVAPGRYRANFRGQTGRTYRLRVLVGEEEYLATSTMPVYTQVDSIGISKNDFFDEERYMVSVKFQDPPEVPNYYRYLTSVNGSPFKFIAVYNDKFNDGRYIGHDLMDFNNPYLVGDSIVVRRECIDKSAYDFWSSFQSINPGSASPANPTSNISNGALGYFSAYSFADMNIVVYD